jgi:hypothetical protein
MADVALLPDEVVPQVLTIQEALRECGFSRVEANLLEIQAFPQWNVFLRMTSKDITSIAEDYGKRTIADGRIVFGFFRTKELQGLMHWVQDMQRLSRDPGLQAPLTQDNLAIALANNEIRKNLSDNMETAAKAADPGKLRTNTDWYTWSQGFINYLSTIPGCTGIPLSYIVRELEEPTDPEDEADYLTSLVLRAPLEGPAFVADRRQVHQLLTGKVLGETAEEWIRDYKTRQNGRVDFEALRTHFEGEGNVSRRISQAEALRKSLSYKQERSMKFSVFLNRMQVMFQIYKQEGEELAESAKIRFLLDQTQATHLQQAVTNLKFQLNQGTLTFESAKNWLMTEVIKSSDYMQNNSRSVAAASTGDKKSPHKKKSGGKSAPKGDEWITKPAWNKLSREQQSAIRKYRDENGLPGGTKTIKAVSSSQATTSGMSDEDIGRIVAAIEARSSTSATVISSVSGSAGQAFGGKSEAASRRLA